MATCTQWMADLEILQARVTIEYPVYRVMSEDDVKHVTLKYMFIRGCLAEISDRVHPLDIRYLKCIDSPSKPLLGMHIQLRGHIPFKKLKMVKNSELFKAL
ncbi:UNVERIFIED_CONTAM: hypothetical protein NCL1_41793 [Trichonephila clavipes]